MRSSSLQSKRSLTYLNTSNQILFKVLLFNYLYVCFILECYCSILLSFRNFALFKFKKLQITIQTQITKHKVEKSIFNDVCSIVSTYIIAKLALCNGLKIYFSETLCNHLHTPRSCLKTNFFPNIISNSISNKNLMKNRFHLFVLYE